MIRMESICLACLMHLGKPFRHLYCTCKHLFRNGKAILNTVLCHLKSQHNVLPCQQCHLSLQAQTLPSALMQARGALTLYKVRRRRHSIA